MRHGYLLYVAWTAGAAMVGCATGSSWGDGGTGGTGGTGGDTGGARICQPMSTIACYTGPSGTLGVGACQGGTQTCNSAGTGYGLCEGEVTPAQERCDTPQDDDCDGTALDEDAGCVCLPSAAVLCYSGPTGTQGVGICTAGESICNAAGTQLGVCLGEVLPAKEECTTPEDEDCDGDAAVCGVEVWSRGFGDAASQVAKALAVQADGTSFLAGAMYGTVDFGAGPLVSLGGSDAFLVKLDGSGATVWARRFGDGGNQEARAVAVDTGGDTVIAGFFSGTVDFGGGAVTSAGSNDIFVAKLNGSGSHLWSKRFGNNSNQYGNAVALAKSGDVVVAGHYGGAVDFGGGALTAAGGTDAFLAVLGADGAHKWSKSFGNGSHQYAYGVAAHPGGNIVVAGSFEGQIDLGGGLLSTAGLADIFVASFGAAGNHVWSKRFGSSGQQYAYGVAAGSGNIALTGAFAGSVDFGCGVLTSAGGNDLYVAVLDTTGACLFSHSFGDAADQTGNAVAFDAGGNVVVTGAFAGSVTIGSQVLTSAGGQDVVVAKLDAGGAPVWAARAGDSVDQSGLAVGTDGASNLFVAGSFAGALDFGGGALTSAGADDAFVIELLP